MEKTKTIIRIAGKEFAITGTDSEEHMQTVAAWVDRRMHELYEMSRLPGAQLAILTAVNAADDMMKSRDEILRLKRQIAELQGEIEALKNGDQA